MSYLILDEFEDVIASLKMALHSFELAEFDCRFWKSAIVFTHAALQGACVCLLTRTDGTGTLAQKNEKALMNKLYGDNADGRLIDNPKAAWPDEFIATLPELLSRLPGGLAMKLPERNAANYGWDRAGDMRRLHEFRNQFAHFPPTSWSLELDGLPRILSAAIKLTLQISESNYYKRWNKFLDNDEIKVLTSAN